MCVNDRSGRSNSKRQTDGRTRLAYKAEHVTDLETGAILAVSGLPGSTMCVDFDNLNPRYPSIEDPNEPDIDCNSP